MDFVHDSLPLVRGQIVYGDLFDDDFFAVDKTLEKVYVSDGGK